MSTLIEARESTALLTSGQDILLQATSWLEHYQERELALSLLSCRLEVSAWEGEDERYDALLKPIEVTLIVPPALWSVLAFHADDAEGLVRRAITESLGRGYYVREMHCTHLPQLRLAA